MPELAEGLTLPGKWLKGRNTLHVTATITLTLPSPVDEFSKITNWVKLKNKQHHSNVRLNSFPMNGHTLGFCP